MTTFALHDRVQLGGTDHRRADGSPFTGRIAGTASVVRLTDSGFSHFYIVLLDADSTITVPGVHVEMLVVHVDNLRPWVAPTHDAWDGAEVLAAVKEWVCTKYLLTRQWWDDNVTVTVDPASPRLVVRIAIEGVYEWSDYAAQYDGPLARRMRTHGIFLEPVNGYTLGAYELGPALLIPEGAACP